MVDRFHVSAWKASKPWYVPAIITDDERFFKNGVCLFGFMPSNLLGNLGLNFLKVMTTILLDHYAKFGTIMLSLTEFHLVASDVYNCHNTSILHRSLRLGYSIYGEIFTSFVAMKTLRRILTVVYGTMHGMEVRLPEGKWMVAVSGGVDSVVLLHLLAQKMINDQRSKTSILVAHFDHGIRANSADDAAFVRGLAKQYNLPFFMERTELGAGTSEATARRARYEFLRRVQHEQQADGIVTAHHQDDLLETMVLNLQRGTGSRGLSSLRSRPGLLRPLLGYSKSDMYTYAKQHNLQWHEDETNALDSYSRNRIRHSVVSKMTLEDRLEMVAYSLAAKAANDEIDQLVERYLAVQPAARILSRPSITGLPDEVGREILAVWLRRETDVEISRKMLERLLVAVHVGRNNSLCDIARGWSLHVKRDTVRLVHNP